jgi:nicotinate phosphoribosyltransferase
MKIRLFVSLANRTKIRRQLNDLWVDCRDQIQIKALYDGDTVEPWEPFLTIEGPQQYFAYLETVLLGVIARPTATATATAKVVKAARGKPICFFRHALIIIGSRRLMGMLQ